MIIFINLKSVNYMLEQNEKKRKCVIIIMLKVSHHRSPRVTGKQWSECTQLFLLLLNGLDDFKAALQAYSNNKNRCVHSVHCVPATLGDLWCDALIENGLHLLFVQC